MVVYTEIVSKLRNMNIIDGSYKQIVLKLRNVKTILW